MCTYLLLFVALWGSMCTYLLLFVALWGSMCTYLLLFVALWDEQIKSACTYVGCLSKVRINETKC